MCAGQGQATQLWLLAKRLAEAGVVSDAGKRVILHEQAVFATNPRRERREEIEALLRDHKVMAAKCVA